MSQQIKKLGSAISVEWVKDVPEPELRQELPKQPLEEKPKKPRKILLISTIYHKW